MADIDWSVFDEYPEDTVECRCGAAFRSHGKLVRLADNTLQLVARKPCPACKRNDDLRALRSDPQPMVLR